MCDLVLQWLDVQCSAGVGIELKIDCTSLSTSPRSFMLTFQQPARQYSLVVSSMLYRFRHGIDPRVEVCPTKVARRRAGVYAVGCKEHEMAPLSRSISRLASASSRVYCNSRRGRFGPLDCPRSLPSTERYHFHCAIVTA